MTLSLTNSLAFLLGFGFAFVPSVGPFAAVLFFLASRWSFRRSDLLWALAALLFGLSLSPHQGLPGFAFGVLQIVGPWLVYRAFGRLRKAVGQPVNTRALSIGLLSGLALVVGLGWLNIGQFDPFTYKTLSQAIVWTSPPALYGHTVLILGAIIAILAQDARYRFLGLGVSALGILVSGSREAAIAWVFITLILILSRQAPSRRSRIAELVLLAFILSVAAGLGPFFGWGRLGFLLDIVPASDTRNLVQGSEIANGDWWDTTWVKLEPGLVTLDGRELTSYTVQKTGSESWRRLQQVIPILSSKVYTLSVWLRPEGEAQPGVQGWGQLGEDRRTFTLTSSLADGRWQASSSGPGRVLDHGVAATDGAWRRVYVTFIYEGAEPVLYWYLGLAPDQRETVGVPASFAGFQLEPGARPTPYRPGPATRGLSLGVARIPFWKSAWAGVQERPLFGWGEGAFPEYYRAAGPDQVKLQAIPAHVHNLFLQTLFERGVVGFAGLLLFILILLGEALRPRNLTLLAVLAAALFINLFDVTLFYGGVLYPLAAVIGWRSSRSTQASAHAETPTNLLLVRLVLAATDFAAAYLALLSAFVVGGFLGFADDPTSLTPASSVFYALLLWPVMAWREGLYPGYGITESQELRKQVVAVTYAGGILAVGTLLFSAELTLPPSVLLPMVLLSIILAPVGRALSKRLLHRLGLWGRSVIILGAGVVGRRVASALTKTPLDGLRPVAFFDDDPAKIGQRLADLPVRGTLEEAAPFAVREGIQHAIVAVSRASPELLTSILRTKGRAFSQVQFVPNLAGLPVFGVSVSSLDKLLALEVPNELASPLNRTVKRVFDLLAVTLGGVLISPFLALLALAVYLDDPGPIFFGHTRIGRDGRTFKAWKFRTMTRDAETVLGRYLNEHPNLCAEWLATQKLQDDPRITRVGKWLRKLSLDEFPQLWNVFKGEMSLVGPRPIVEEEVAKYDADFDLYKMVRPGMTGYWQVSGRSDTDYAYRVELDSFYVRNWSIWLDIVILLKTPQVVFGGEGAY